jgi:hypothetical protein
VYDLSRTLIGEITGSAVLDHTVLVLFEHDLSGNRVRTFPDYALIQRVPIHGQGQ